MEEKLNENEVIENYNKAREELEEAKRECWEAFKEFGVGMGIILLSGFVTMFTWNVVAGYFGFKSVSYIVGLCMYMLCRVLFGKRSE